LLAVVDVSNSARVEFSFQVCLFLPYYFVREFYLFVISAIDLVPDKPIDVLAGDLDFFVDSRHSFLTIGGLLLAVVDDLG